jgi:hypothetical protein
VTETVELVGLNALFLVIGVAVVRLVGLPFRGAWLASALGLSPMVGVVTGSVVAAEVATVGLPIGVITVGITAVALVLAAVVFAPRMQQRLGCMAPQPQTPLGFVAELGLFGVLVYFSVNLIRLLVVTPLNSWDGWAIWAARAHELFVSGDAWNTAFHSPPYYPEHPDYPILYPSLESLSMHAIGRFDVALIHVEPGVYLISAALALWALLRLAIPRWLAALSGVALAGLTPLVQNFSWNYADGAIAVTSALALVCLTIWLISGASPALWLATVFLASEVLIKKEGLMFAAASLAAAAAASRLARRRTRSLLPVTGVVLAVYAPWQVFISANGLRAVDTFRFSPGYLLGHTGRVPQASHALLSNLIHVWTLPSIAGVLAFAAAMLTRRYAVSLFAGVWAALGFAGLVGSYVASTLDLTWQLQTSADRVVGTLAVGIGTLAPLLGWQAWPYARHAFTSLRPRLPRETLTEPRA